MKLIDEITADEKGQALTELVCVIPLLLCVMLIVLFVAGSGLSHIRALKEARSNAEAKAVKTMNSSAGSAIHSWRYNGIVPFSAKDTMTSRNHLAASITVEDALDNRSWSANEQSLRFYEYYIQSFSFRILITFFASGVDITKSLSSFVNILRWKSSY